MRDSAELACGMQLVGFTWVGAALAAPSQEGLLHSFTLFLKIINEVFTMTQRYYSFSLVSYASLSELQPLFSAAKHWAYILHDKDKTDVHFHIVCTFSIAKSLNAVRKLPCSSQNTLGQELKDVDAMLTYFTHQDMEGEKFVYDKKDIVYDDAVYWGHRVSSGDIEDSSNDVFIEDLLSDNMTFEFMARKYGRDFMKNYKSYMEFRSVVLVERVQGHNGSDYTYHY